MTAVVEGSRRNGVDTATLFATLDAVKGQPEIAKFQFRASNTWLSGTHNRSTISGLRASENCGGDNGVPFFVNAPRLKRISSIWNGAK